MARTRFGLTWWGQRWVAALEAAGALDPNRLPRGRTYARRGAVADLTVQAGRVTARVAGSRAQPYRVTLALPAFDDATWDAIVAALAGEVRHAAALLDGQMPTDVDDALATCGVSLFPAAGELATHCSCPDWANPCKHVAALHYVLAQAFDADPFLLPTLRGRDRDGLLAGLRAARSGGERAPEQDEPDGPVAVSSLSAATLFTAAGDLDALAVHPAEPSDPGATLRRLGAPPGCDDADLAALERLAADGAELAWRIATGEEAATPDDTALAALRARGSATSAELAGDLGCSVAQARDRLRPLVDAGAVRRTGRARGTRYHA